MRFRDFPEAILGSKVKIKVLLQLLAENMYSERDLAERIGVSHTAVNKVMKELMAANLVKPLKVGNVNIWTVNKDSYAFKTIADAKSIVGLEYLAKNPPLEELKGEFSIFHTYPGVKNVVIFGSIAEGTEKPDSDIDIFILVEDRSVKKTVMEKISKLNEKFIRKYGNNLSVLAKTIKEYGKMNKNLVKNIERGIVVIRR